MSKCINNYRPKELRWFLDKCSKYELANSSEPKYSTTAGITTKNKYTIAAKNTKPDASNIICLPF